MVIYICNTGIVGEDIVTAVGGGPASGPIHKLVIINCGIWRRGEWLRAGILQIVDAAGKQENRKSSKICQQSLHKNTPLPRMLLCSRRKFLLEHSISLILQVFPTHAVNGFSVKRSVSTLPCTLSFPKTGLNGNPLELSGWNFVFFNVITGNFI